MGVSTSIDVEQIATANKATNNAPIVPDFDPQEIKHKTQKF